MKKATVGQVGYELLTNRQIDDLLEFGLDEEFKIRRIGNIHRFLQCPLREAINIDEYLVKFHQGRSKSK